ncbi:FtsQ-type POTRA domain-containing protein [Paenibacillus sp. YPG26]|uniref:cell division protein FtsQ/DivIB n=1 Tax=Paenibacillus sp. YPG26 TaxID=2878915 RepID=UPI00203E2195|nr:FtsQ-type POTRA domain-containing protein [Paenibacillus sp. YPG26]USB34506.1 FtsQ-type POTRA domain-containing protein [Paenibacillus sp. YPG26]
MPKANVPVLKKDKPRMKTSRKVIAILILLFIVLMGVLFFRSQISKISEIRFTGNAYSTDAELLKQMGIQVGSPFFGTSESTIRERLAGIPSIEKITVDKQFPGLISITIKEYRAVAYSLNKDGSFAAYLANGTEVPVKNGGIAAGKPLLTKWKKNDPNLIKLCSVLGQIPDNLTADISEIIPSPTASYPDRIKMYTSSHFEVITAISLLTEKIEDLNLVIDTQEPGTLTMLEADSYSSFGPVEDNKEPQKETTNQ